MRRMITATVAVLLLTAGCSASTAENSTSTAAPPSGPSPTTDPVRADANLILTMYDDITQAFQRNPDDGVRAIIAYQYPDDVADVDFARCVNAISPGATTLPPDKKLHFVPNIATMTPDPGYTLTSDRVKNLQPRGRIYQTDIEINDGTKPTVRQRHQVVLEGKVYQFSSC